MFDKNFLIVHKNYITKSGNKVKYLYEYDSVNLKLFIAIDSLAFGPAVGGCRFINDLDREKAIDEVCKLAKSMTEKNILAGLNFGGGKSYIYYCNMSRNDMLFDFAALLNYLDGIYYTADDVNTSIYDMEYMRKYTKYAKGCFYKNKQIPATSYGVYLAMLASVEEFFEGRTLSNLKVSIQGMGKVGRGLSEFLIKKKAEVYAADICENEMYENFQHIKWIAPNSIINSNVDILSPCAYGGVITNSNCSTIKARLIVGGANNQLENEKVNYILKKYGIIYIPDILANCGGVIDLAAEGKNYSPNFVFEKVQIIYKLTKMFIQESRRKNCTVFDELNVYINTIRTEKEKETKCAEL